MRAVIVDPVKREVRQEEIKGDLKSLQEAVGGCIQLVYLDGVAPALADHYCYLDEEGRLKPEKIRSQRWVMDGWSEPYLVGPAVILREGRGGNDAPATVSVADVHALVTFL